MTNTTDIICDDDYREKYESIKIVIIVCATIFHNIIFGFNTFIL